MAEPFLGELKMVSFNFPPKGWAFCNGQLLPINQNQALFSLLGTMYGGNGQTHFALPDLRGRTPIHIASGFAQGQRAGTTAHTLIPDEMAAHTHALQASRGGVDLAPLDKVLGNAGSDLFVPPSLLGPLPGETVEEDEVTLSWQQGVSTFYASAGGNQFAESALVQMNPGAISTVGGSQPHNNMQPYLGMYFVIALQGIFPSAN
ncbi:MAG TPA: tail fiber protein [Rubricoccaceae bacterium]|jgi:microcystin-dependent protein